MRTPNSGSGWRGADAIGFDDNVIGGSGGMRMGGSLVKSIWSCSRLPGAKLKLIWLVALLYSGVLPVVRELTKFCDRNECDPGRTGSLDREAFVQGMWSIDGELAKAAKVAARRQRG